MCVCECCVYVCVCTCVYVCVCVCTYVCVCMCVYVCAMVCVRVCVYMCVRMVWCVRIICVCMYVCVYVCVYQGRRSRCGRCGGRRTNNMLSLASKLLNLAVSSQDCTRNDLRRSKIKNFLGGGPPDPPYGTRFARLLRFSVGKLCAPCHCAATISSLK